MKRLAAAACLVTVLGSRSAFAQAAREDVRLVYQAAEGCPTESWLVGRIAGRTDRFREVAAGQTGRTFSIVITGSDGAYSGTFEITELEPSPRSSSRHIDAKSCEEVADGLALIAALTIDPRAKMEAVDEQPPKVEKPVPVTPPPPPPPKPPPPAQNPDRSAPYFELGAGFVGVTGAAPTLLYGGEGFVEAGFRSPLRWFSPGLRIAYRDALRDGVAFDQGSAYFRLSVVAVDLWPLRAPIPVVGIRLCAAGELGWLEAQGSEGASSVESRRGWGALGTALRIGASTSRVGIEASFGAEAPLRRDRFFFESEIGEVNIIVFYAGLALTGRIY